MSPTRAARPGDERGGGPSAARRRRPRWLLLVPVLLVAVELAGILLVGEAIGAGWTLLLLLLGVVVGSVLLVRGGVGGLQRAARSGRQGTGGLVAGRELVDAGLLGLGAVLLVLPGFLSDLVGVLCVLPPTRPLVRRLLGYAVGGAVLRAAGLRRDDVRRARAARGDVVPGQVVVRPDVGPDVGPDIGPDIGRGAGGAHHGGEAIEGRVVDPGPDGAQAPGDDDARGT